MSAQHWGNEWAMSARLLRNVWALVARLYYGYTDYMRNIGYTRYGTYGGCFGLWQEHSDSPSASEEGSSYISVRLSDTLRFVRGMPHRFPRFSLISHSLSVKRTMITFSQVHDVRRVSHNYLTFISSSSPPTNYLSIRRFLWKLYDRYPIVWWYGPYCTKKVAHYRSFLW